MSKNPWSTSSETAETSVPNVAKPAKRKWRVLPILWGALKKTCMALGAVMLISIIVSGWMVSSLVGEIKVELPEQMVLYMDLDGDIGDLPKPSSFADPFSNTGKTVKTFIDALNRAKNDDRVEGICARLVGGRYDLAHIQEIRAAIKDFRESGKFAYIYAPSYGGGLGSYYLVSSFEEIWMQPVGSVMITGINAEMPFLRGALDKIGIEPQFFQRKEYKNAYESLTNESMSEANRHAMNSLVADLSDVITADIAADMGISELEFKALVDRGLFTHSEALAARLIDKSDYADKLIEKINEQVTGDSNSKDLAYVSFDRYIDDMMVQGDDFAAQLFSGEVDDSDDEGRPKVALIYAVGTIMDNDGADASIQAGLMGGRVAGADKIARALFMAAEDTSIDAVVLRVDSPGGSPVASETILRAVQKVQEEGKSVTVSMGGTAASGGYWIASYADQIFALPSTITGSIGVLGGKLSAQKLWQNLGINWESVSWGDNSGMWSMNTPFSEGGEERMNAMLDNIYDSFVARVATGRKMSVDDVEKIARGRVWVGKSALDKGLVDQFGGLNDALDYAAVKAGAADR
ncbi:MAG: signal peptide peptidase SppA, partial [Alphaproteobacteria bacterium]|nr:signal peptide peptidase SppA [Alphaproteobacteria bacterium]